MSEDKKEKIEEVKDEEIKESVTSETEENTNEEKTETKAEEVEPKVDETASVEQKNKEEKGLTKTAKIAIGAAVGAVAAVAAIVIPTGVVLSQNSLEDRDKIFIDYNIDGINSESIEIDKETRIADLKLKPIEGYVFVGWFKDEACTQEYLPNDIIVADSTVYAKYQIALYMITFPTGEHFRINQETQIINYGDEVRFTITYDEGYSNNIQNAVVKANGRVLSAESDGSYLLSGIKENTVITIDDITIDKYTATLNIDGELKTKEVEYGQTIADWLEELGLSEENTIGFFTSEELTREGLYDVSLPISSDLNLFTKKATLEVFDFYEYGYNGYYRAVIKDNTSEAVVPLKYNEGEIQAISNNSSIIQTVYLSVNVREVYGSAFEGCELLNNINLNNILRIGDSAFEGCSNLDVDFTNLKDLNYIGEAAFAMSGVTEVKLIDNSSVSISKSAFNGCEKLKRVEIGSSVDFSYGGLIFANCPNIEYIYWDNNDGGYHGTDQGIGEGDGLLFSNSCTNIEGGARLVIGPNVESMYNINNIFTRSYYGFEDIANIGKILFVEDINNIEIDFVGNYEGVRDEFDHYVFPFAEEIVIDSQRTVNALLQKYDEYQVDDILSLVGNLGCSIYFKDSLDNIDNIDNFVDLFTEDTLGIERQEKSDKEGYIQYKVIEIVE